MLHEATIHSNGISHTPAYPPCPSDYEAMAPAGSAPQPKWRDAWPIFTHNCGWTDSDGKTHSLTIRTDDADELFGILKAVKHIVRASKEKAAETASQPPQQAATPAETQPDIQHCHIHGVDMPRRWSKRTNGHYFAHKMPDGSFCYGRAKS